MFVNSRSHDLLPVRVWRITGNSRIGVSGRTGDQVRPAALHAGAYLLYRILASRGSPQAGEQVECVTAFTRAEIVEAVFVDSERSRPLPINRELSTATHALAAAQQFAGEIAGVNLSFKLIGIEFDCCQKLPPFKTKKMLSFSWQGARRVILGFPAAPLVQFRLAIVLRFRLQWRLWIKPHNRLIKRLFFRASAMSVAFPLYRCVDPAKDRAQRIEKHGTFYKYPLLSANCEKPPAMDIFYCQF